MSDPARPQRPSLEDVKAELSARAEELALALLGPPNRDTAQRPEWRWGAKGSAAFVVRDHGGKRAGSFFTHEGGQGGSPLDFVMFARACGIAEAIRWAEHWLGYDRADYVPEPVTEAVLAERARAKAEREREAAAAAVERVGIACKLWSEAVPVDHTPAEIYLTDTRRIPMPPQGWSGALRFHPRSRSLIVAATDAAGDVQAVQRVFLTPDGQKISDEERERRQLPAGKLTNGVMDGAAVRLPARTLGARTVPPVLLAEGPETALSAWVSTGHETWVALGGLGKLPLMPDRIFVVARDDDARFSNAEKGLRRALAAWRSAGHKVTVATPWAIRRHDKSDFNDLLREHGHRAVQRRIEQAVRIQATPIRREPIKAVREHLDGVIRAFFEDAAAWGTDGNEEGTPDYRFPDHEEQIPGHGDNEEPPPARAVKVEVGAGKSRSAYRYAAQMIETLRRSGDRRAIVVAVPTHKLGDEQVKIFDRIANPEAPPLPEAIGPEVTLHLPATRRTALVWRGMEAVDPDHPDAADDTVPHDAKTRMCQNLEAAKDARAANLPVFKSVCHRKLEDGTKATCPFFGQCGYQRQRQAAPDVWIVPHELLFMSKPAALGKIAALVVDESCWADGLEGVHGRPMAVPLSDLRQSATVSWKGSVEHIATDRLSFLRTTLADALEHHADGHVRRDVLEDSDLSSTNAGEAYTLEWRRFVDPKMHPLMSREERKEALAAAKGNAQVMRLAKVWKGVQALLAANGPDKSGWLTVASEPDDEDGSIRRVLHLKGRRSVARGWQVPTLLLDATMNVELVRPYWPQVEVVAELLAAAPHQHVRQVIDKAFSKSMLDPITQATIDTDPRVAALVRNKPDEPERRARNLRRLHATLCREARRYAPARVLIVCQKAVKEALPGIGPLPVNVELAHHNAVAGRDEWGPQPDRPGIRALIVVGRTLPAIGAVNRLAEALSGIAVEEVAGGWYDRGDAIREGLDGAAEVAESERHPNPIAEAIRWQICEGELVQIIGRGRGVNRTAANPLDVLVLTDAPIPVPVAETLSAADLDPSPDDLMAAAGGVILRNTRHAATAYPGLWPNHDAARKAAQRSGTFPYIYSLFIGNCPTPPTAGTLYGATATYRLAGPGQKPVEAWFDPQLVGDAVSWLSDRLGLVATFEAEGIPPSPARQSPANENQAVAASRAAVLPSVASPFRSSRCGLPEPTPANRPANPQQARS